MTSKNRPRSRGISAKTSPAIAVTGASHSSASFLIVATLFRSCSTAVADELVARLRHVAGDGVGDGAVLINRAQQILQRHDLIGELLRHRSHWVELALDEMLLVVICAQ